MGSKEQRFLVQQLSLTLSAGYASYAPGESTPQQNSASEYWAGHLASSMQQALFVDTWRAGYHFHWTVQHAALTFTQTRNSAKFSRTVSGAVMGLREQLGEVGVASLLFDEQLAVPQPRDERQALLIGHLVQCCRFFAGDLADSTAIWTALLQDGTWRRLMTWAVRGLDEAFVSLVPAHDEPFPVSQLSNRSGVSELLCGWYLDAGMSAQEQAHVIRSAIDELTSRGYRDVTELVRPYYKGGFDDLCVLQQPDGSPVYCRAASEVFALLQIARSTYTVGTQPAADPSHEVWRVVGNFNQLYQGG